jgi:hypothetical protein
MSKQVQNQEEEIDLGGFFNQIGKLFLKLFKLIVDSIKGMYHVSILVFIFVKNHFIKLSIGTVLGVGLGIFAHKYSDKSYVYEMAIIPNYESGIYIKNKLDFYNQLIKQKDYTTLSNLFGIDLIDAKSITKFEFEKIADSKDLVEGYDDFIKQRDTSTIKEFPLKKYLQKDFSEFYYKKYIVRMYTKKPSLKNNINENLVKDLENNTYLNEKKALMLNTLTLKDSAYKSLLRIIDTIIIKDKDIALIAANNGDKSASNINLSNGNNANKDFDLLQLYKGTSTELASMNESKIKLGSIFQVIAPLEPIGKEKINIFLTTFFKVFFLVMFITIASIQYKPFLKYLENYKKEKKSDK